MAKKVATKQAEEGVFEGRDGAKFYKEGGKGKKPCPKCGVFVAARHKGQCPNPDCDHNFEGKEGGKKPKAEVFVSSSFADTIETLQKVKAYAKDFGGVDKLADKLDSLEEITMQTGGIDGLRKALEALKQL